MEALRNIAMPWRATSGNEEEQHGGGTASTVIVMILMFVCGIGAAYLCWKCNVNEDLGQRIIYTIISFLYGIPYLIYYLVVRILLKAPCKCCGV